MPLAIENSAALLLLLAIPGVYLVARGRLSRMSPWRRRAILATRVLSMAAATLAIANPSLPMRDSTMSVAFVVDGSDSIALPTRTEQEEWVRQAAGGMRANDRAAVVALSSDPWVVKPLSGERDFRLPAGGALRGDTNIPSALRLASGLLPASGLRKVVLLSDGWDTEGEAREAAGSLPEGTRLDVVTVPAMAGRSEVLIESLEVPSHVREGDTFDVNAVIGSSHEASAEVSMLVDGRETGSWEVQLGTGANLVTLFQPALPAGFHSVEVHLSGGGDTMLENNSASGFVVVKDRGSVLLVTGGPDTGSNLDQLLEESGLDVEQRMASEFPMQISDLLPFDSIVLEDVSGLSLSLDQMKTVETYVREQGRGLTVVGGPNSFGLGDYASGPMEQLLPVSSNVPLTRERGDMALILVIDRSGSMDDSSQGISKMEMAKEAAQRAIEVLRPDDQIGILTFDIEMEWVVPPRKVGDSVDDIRTKIRRIHASGGTDIYTALQESYDATRSLRATQKHITLMSDGQSWKGQYELLLERIRRQGITLSSIAVGEDADQAWLSSLARLGDGRYYFTENFAEIPNIVYREVSLATKVAEIQGEVVPLFVSPSPLLRGVDVEAIPSLSGYVATRPKEAATTVLRSERGDPLLAHWQHGLGRVAAWTSDSEGLWSAGWLSDESTRRIWDQAVRWTMPPPIERSLQVEAWVDGKHVTISASSVDHNGRFIDLADTRADIQHPNGSTFGVSLVQTAPGRYEVSLPASGPGLYRVDVRQVREGSQEVRESSGYVIPSAPELRRLGSNEALLKEMASITGGRAVSDPATAFSREGMASAPGWEPLWPYLLALSLVLLPVEVAIRRIRSLPRGVHNHGGTRPEQGDGGTGRQGD